MTVHPAIGHSTNLIGRDSNIIVIRGGNERGRSVYAQMLHAVEEFFPETEIPAVSNSDELPTSPDATYPLQRINTGISSIVGSNNGDRPGGFVLVLEGTALEYVSASELCIPRPV